LENNRWIYVGGTFDLFHYGHARFLEQCSKYGKVIVAINTDDFCERYKRKPVLTLGERIESVAACKWVDEVIVNIGDEDSGVTIDTIKDKKVTHIAHGDDWTGDSLIEQLGISQEWLDERGISMLYVPYTKGISTEINLTSLRHEFPSVIFHEEPNKEDWGHDKRAKGLDLATSDYVGWFNHDDSYNPDYISEMMRHAEDGNDVVYCGWSGNHTPEFRLASSTSGNYIVRTKVGRDAGYGDRHYEADGTFINRIAALTTFIKFVNRVLYYHNEVKYA